MRIENGWISVTALTFTVSGGVNTQSLSSGGSTHIKHTYARTYDGASDGVIWWTSDWTSASARYPGRQAK